MTLSPSTAANHKDAPSRTKSTAAVSLSIPVSADTDVPSIHSSNVPSFAPGALAGIRDRPIVLKRFVDGAEGQAFYQKRAPGNRPEWLRRPRP